MNQKERDELDASLIQSIKNGNKHMRDIVLTGKYPNWTRLTEAARIVDKRLQALRRKGLITYTGQKTGWQIVESK